MKRMILAAALLSASMLASTAASAAAVINADGSVTYDDVGDTATITYNGMGGDPTALTPGLSATLSLTLAAGSDDDTYIFNYVLNNTSTVAGTRISGIGFNVTPNATSISSGGGGVFDEWAMNTNFASAGNIETCFNGGPGDCPQSNNGNSVAFNGSTSGTLTFNLLAASDTFTFDDFVIRYQGFNTTNVNGAQVSSAVGYGNPGPIPEPGTWAMMLLGFGGIGMALRRRNRKVRAVMQVA